ncbi:MAG TPA: chemotaxis protein CheA [Myxococcota bacterium]|nr:chemotaxis protein CheA [Myxococcota bacterium]HRY95632.1 chemotaxis protein CheA [Myxococcota bacterium]HSA20343.1 chemotaxis protein CheA [Myxococcota bacterium]
MSKYKPLFLSEAGEHLDGLETELVALERAPGEQERIHEAFRHLHSVKSMAASMDYEHLAHLAHRLEDLVSPHRDTGAPFAAEEIDLLLAGLDALRASLRCVAADQPEPELPAGLMADLDTRLRAAGPARVRARSSPASPGPAAPAAPVEPSAQAPVAGALYTVEAQVIAECSLPGARALVLFQRLAALGEVVGCEPSLEELRLGNLPERRVRLRVRSQRGADELRRAVEGVPELAAQRVAPAAEGGSPRSPQPAPAASAPAGPSPPEPGPLPAPTPGSSVRVRAELLDFFVDAVAELLGLRSHLEALAEQRDDPALQEGVRQLGTLARRLQDRVMQVRMVPAATLTGRLPRLVRDLARARGLEVELQVSGEEVELDRGLVEALDTPLLHLVRNALDHGLETPAERRAWGKEPVGRLRLHLERRQDRVQLSLEDDGRGIDPALVLARAEAVGLLPPGAVLGERAAQELVFLPGFSIRTEASESAGRGVGLDVVRTALQRLGGRIELESTPGRGTRFVLDLPLTLAILHVLLVQAGEHLLALPSARVLRALTVRPSQLSQGPGGPEVLVGSRRLPFTPLLALLGERLGPPPAAQEAILVGPPEGEASLALGVDRVTGHREAALRAAGALLGRLGPYGGSTVLGDGRPVLILDVDALIARAARAAPERPGEA